VKRMFIAFAGICLSVSMLVAARAGADMYAPANLPDLMKANVVITGTCTAKDAHVKDGILVTTYTFSVENVLKAPDGLFKGTQPQNFTFTQWGASRDDAKRLNMRMPPGIVTFEVGDKRTIFLTGESKLGFRSVLAGGQGSFRMIEGKDGKTQVVNEYGNKSLFNNLPTSKSVTKALTVGGVQTGQAGPIDYESFTKMIDELKQPETKGSTKPTRSQ